MAVTKVEVIEITAEAIAACRREVDRELIRLHEQDKENAWTEERALELAEKASDLAVKKITDNFYKSIGKKTVTAVGVAVVGVAIFLKEEVLRWIGIGPK